MHLCSNANDLGRLIPRPAGASRFFDGFSMVFRSPTSFYGFPFSIHGNRHITVTKSPITMPPKKSSSKKKSKARVAAVKAKTTTTTANATNDATANAPPAPALLLLSEDRAERGSTQAAAALAQRFGANHPPFHSVDDYELSVSKAVRRNDENAYSRCCAAYNRGIELTTRPSGAPGISCRWHAAQEAFFDAIDSAMTAPESFLTTHGNDRRRLLCKAALSVAQVRGKVLDGPGMVAWGQAAVAADPKYFNAHSQLSFGLQHVGCYKEALEEMKVTMELEGFKMSPFVSTRIGLLEKAVLGSKEEKEAAIMAVLKDRTGSAVRYWQEMGVSRPAKSCAFCFWNAENKCARCRTVYYCQRACQKAHYSEHKLACVSAEGTVKQTYTKADYPKDELCSDEHWVDLCRSAAQQGNTPIIHCASNNCLVGAVKRALMEGDDVNDLFVFEYPIHRAAIRNEPDSAADIFGVLLRHGACPNVLRGDGRHLLEVCRDRARWIDDDEPSMENIFFRMSHLGESLEEVERAESEKLVGLVTDAIKRHKMCRYCKGRKQATGKNDAHLSMPNLTDIFYN